ncbi:hypothetical protein CBS147339_2563 [Penicillium roqueforti]|uniref:O-methyltransferase mpaG n=1 Tax=Penicillium roqueforti (strain FM164) TaxID=1365484 RepID=MPAG_PENRF|nr:RecName: Full=O-methyltransferase mpaG; AltName: Full=Mycophenolic acid biosynthesis cluster protein G [Penicillium roqueforti FM164]KAI3082683.1 hypothetical protein CBS147339_2563 [Penicillium roqueforti]KAI3100917.1 hypothetical protein CBS147338_3295 [Penicillium roqueforti]KAI3176314.1 hypothetical protein DTO032C6_9671 [Penicillium roqueforti]CDM36722.1 O-methyltransferase, caffeic acid-type [Penicillium roqueforti FM164]
MLTKSVTSILQGITLAAKEFENNEAGARESLIAHSRALISALEVPSEFIQHTFWSQPALSAIIRLAADVNMFQHLKDAAGKGIDCEALSMKTGVDASLLSRLARHLVAMNVITFQNGAFHGTDLSDSLAAENYQHSIRFCHDVSRPSFNEFPEFFKSNGYKTPTLSGTDGPFQAAHKTELTFLQWLVNTHPYLQYFHSYMSVYRAGKQNWCDTGFYPVSERLLSGFDASVSDVVLVDVGGGRGHDLETFASKFSPLPGRLVLQDREQTIASMPADESRQFEATAHNIFTPQPVKYARAYYMHSVPHGFGDEDAIKIMANLVPALAKGYSRVLLNEIVVSEENPILAATNMDMIMLAHLAVKERTEAEWRYIFTQAGLKVVNIYSYPGVAESLIEAELA